MSKIIARITTFKNIEYFVLSIILIFGFILRIYKIDNPVADWHSFRQADTASVARTFVQDGINLLLPRYHDISTIQSGKFNPQGFRFVEFPVYNALIALFVKAFPFFSLEVWARLISVFFSLVSCLFLFLIGRRFIGIWGGVLASFFFLFIPYNIYFTRVILPEPIATTFALAALWFFAVYSKENKKSLLYVSALSLSLALLIKPFTIFYVVPIVYLIFQEKSFKTNFLSYKQILPFIYYLAIVLIPFLAWRVWISQHPEGIPFFWWVLNGDGIRFKPSFWRWIFGERLGYLILGVWGVVPFTLGLFRKSKDNFAQYFILGMFLYVVVVATANVRHDYYQTLTIPAITLILSNGTLYIWNFERKILARGMLLFSVLLMMITGFSNVKEFYKINHPEIISAGIKVDKILPANALIIAPYNGDTAFLYQTKRWGWPYVDRPIDEMIAEGAEFYISVNFDSQTKEFMQRFPVLEKNDKFVILKLH